MTGPRWFTNAATADGAYLCHELRNPAGDVLAYVNKPAKDDLWYTPLGTGVTTWHHARTRAENELSYQRLEDKQSPWWDGAEKVRISHHMSSVVYTRTKSGLYQHENLALDPRPAYFVMWAWQHQGLTTVRILEA